MEAACRSLLVDPVYRSDSHSVQGAWDGIGVLFRLGSCRIH